MHNRILLLVLTTLIFSCNEKKTNQPQISQGVVLQQEEKNLLDSIKLHPDSVFLKENLLQYYRDKSNYGKAISTTKIFIVSDSLNDRLWNILATLYFENNDTLQSIKCFEKAISIKPMTEYILSVGSLYAETKNPAALKMADILLQSKKTQAQVQAIFMQGLYYSFINEKIKAISFFNKCIDLNYTYMMAYREKAICYYDLGKYDDAITVLQKAITLQNTYSEGYFWLGKCYEKTTQKDAAIECYKTALEIDKNYPEATEALAKMGVK